MELEEANPEISNSESSDEEQECSVYPSAEVQSHTDSVCSVAWHPIQSEIYASGGVDDVAFIYKSNDAKELAGHTDSVISVKFSPCGEYLAAASMDSTVSIFLTSTCELANKYTGPTEEILSISWHPRVLSIMILSADLSLWIWHLKKTEPVAVIYGHPLSIAKFAPAGRFIYAGGLDGSFKVWDMKTEQFESNPPHMTVTSKELHSDEVLCVDLHETGVAISGSKDGSVALLNINSKRVLFKLKVAGESIESVQFCKEMLWFLVASVAGDLKVYECDSLSARCELKLEFGVVRAVWERFNIFVAGTSGKIQCIDGRNGAVVKKYRGCRETILDIDVQHGKIIAGSEDHKVFIWEAFPSQ